MSDQDRLEQAAGAAGADGRPPSEPRPAPDVGSDADEVGQAGAETPADAPAAEAEAGGESEADGGAGAETPPADNLVAEAEALLSDDLVEVVQLERERDEFRAVAQRIQADFENYKKRIVRQQTEHLERAAQDLVVKLLPVLDTADLAVSHDGNESLLQLASSLYDVLQKEGLVRIDPEGQPFDPTEHEAVMHEEGEGGDPQVLEVLRAGYRWKGRLLRPAMVKVKG